MNKTGELIYAADLCRIKGELLLGQSIHNQDAAEDCFRTAIKIARTQQAKILELRATTSMYKLLLEEGRKEEAGELLNTVYSCFSEGFETPDLQSASILLQKLL
jgi:predicted ATPase